jgi:hypothetical protein
LGFKVIVDTLSSLAAFVAIVSVMIGWYRSARKPLKISRVVIHKEDNKNTFILVIRNVKNHPAMIKRVDCYRGKKYEVQKKPGRLPEYNEFHPGSKMIFCCENAFEIPANAHTDIRIEVATNIDIPSKLLFLLETSHGYHDLNCRDISIVNIGKVDVYSLEYDHEFETKYRAKVVYYWELLKELTRLLQRISKKRAR